MITMLRYVCLILLMTAGAERASAQLGTGTNCSVSATPIQFLSYNVFELLPNDGISTVTVTCTGLANLGVSYDLQLGPGSSGDIYARHMTSGTTSDELSYQVYTNIGRTTVWGNGAQGSTISGSLIVQIIATSRIHTVYTRLPSEQVVTSGTYSDAPIMTIVF